MTTIRSFLSLVFISLSTIGFAQTSPIRAPKTTLHYAAGDYAGGNSFPGLRAKFNLWDISDASAAPYMPAGGKALVWVGMCNGVDDAFVKAVTPFIGAPNIYGFYLMDEPDPTGVYHAPACRAEDLKAESDWIHSHFGKTGAKTFIVLMNMASDREPNFYNAYNPGNTNIDLFGIDPYPCQVQFSGCDFSIIGKAVSAALASGIRREQIVPVYQAFGGGGYASYLLPSASQELQILDAWRKIVPNPPFDFAYAWGSQEGDRALENTPELMRIFYSHNTP